MRGIQKIDLLIAVTLWLTALMTMVYISGVTRDPYWGLGDGRRLSTC